MARLKAEPAEAETIRSLPELMAIAHAMELESEARYGELASRMRSIGNEDVATVFERLAEVERTHAVNVTRWSEERVGEAPDPAEARWEGWHETFDEEGLGQTRLVTPYKALSVAVRNEERAFAFWTYVSANTEDPAIRAEAEEMAHEELRHISLLRSARRRAFHEGRAVEEERLEWLLAASNPELAAEAVRLEAGLASIHDHAANRLAQLGHRGSEMLRRAAGEERQNAERLAAYLDPSAPAPEPDPPGELPQSAESVLDIALQRLEAAVELYFMAADTLKNETAVAEAQALAQSAIPRLARLRELREASPS
jgi:rubrerythrin